MVRLQFWLFQRQISYFLKNRDFARIFVASVFLIILVFLFIFSYILGRAFMEYMSSFSQFSYVFLQFTLLSLVSALSALSMLSFTIAYFKTLFDKNLGLFFPVFSGQKVALSVLAITLLMGSWPFLLISLPFFFGLSKLYHNSLIFYLEIFFLHLLLSIVIASLSGILALFLYKTFGKQLARFLPLIIIFSLIGFFLIFTRLIFPANLDQIASQKEITQVEKMIRTAPLAAPILPTTLFVGVVLGEKMSVFWLFIQAILSVLLFYMFSKKYYRSSWQSFYEGYLLAAGDQESKKIDMKKLQSGIFISSIFPPLYTKELLYLKRTINAFIYFSFIVLLSCLFIFFLSRAHILPSDYTRFAPLVVVASFFSVSYLTLLLVIRFIFPTFTLESPFLWLTITSVNIRQKVTLAKWLFSHILVLVFIFILGVAVFTFAKISFKNTREIIFFAVSNAVFITAISLTIGQISQRNLPKEDVEAISTTIPGVFVTVVSLLIGLFCALTIFSPHSFPLALLVFFLSLFFLLFGYSYSLNRYRKDDI